MLTVTPKYCFAFLRGFGLFQQLRYNLSLHLTPGLQSAFYTDSLYSTFTSLEKDGLNGLKVVLPTGYNLSNLMVTLLLTMLCRVPQGSILNWSFMFLNLY